MSPVVRHEVGADRGAPLPDRVPAVLAERVDDGTAGGLEGLAHFVVGGDHQAHLRGFVVGRLGGHHRGAEAAEVVLQVVDAPGGVELGVLHLVVERGGEAGAGLGPGRGVDAELEALGVHVVGQRLHVGELRVGVQHAVGVALALPGVVDVDVDVAGVFHAGGDDLVGGVANVLVGDLVAKKFQLFQPMGGVCATTCGGAAFWTGCCGTFRRRCGLGDGGERKQGKNGGGEDCRNTHEGNLLKTFSVECYRAVVEFGNGVG